MPFTGVDYFQITDLLSEEERLIVSTFRRFVDDEIMPVIGRHFRDGTFDRNWPKQLGALGALACLATFSLVGVAAAQPSARALSRCASRSRTCRHSESFCVRRLSTVGTAPVSVGLVSVITVR